MSRAPSMHVRLSERLWVRLKARMEQTGESKQEAIRTLLALALDHDEKRRTGR